MENVNAIEEKKEEKDVSMEQKQLVLNYYCEYSLHHPGILNEQMNEGRGAHDVILILLFLAIVFCILVTLVCILSFHSI